MAGPDDVRWLDPEERRAWLALLTVVEGLPNALDAQLRPAGLTHFEYLVMAGLSEAPERTRRLSELAAFSRGSLSRLSHVVGRLERRGLVERRPDPQDGRSTLATLTEAGWEVVVATAPGHVSAVRGAVFDALTRAQVGQLEAICTRLARGLDLPVLDPDAG